MTFKELYEAANQAVANSGQPPKPVGFEFLKSLVLSDRDLVAELSVLRVSYQTPTREARFTLFDERDSRHEDPVYIVEISFCASLEDRPDLLLYALTKELMHVFDPMDTWINTREKFISFLRDLQNTPLDMSNGSIHVEHKAKWMAVLALCPQSLRNYIVETCAQKGAMMREELAQELGLPTPIIDIVLDTYYETALSIMLA